MQSNRQKKRRIVTFCLFLIMPLVMKFFSPIMTIKSAMLGIISASIITIGLMFLAGILTGRLWCGWLCPAGGVQDVVTDIGSIKQANNKLRSLKYALAGLQIIAITALLVFNKDISFDYFYQVSASVSGNDWILYYIVIVLFVGLPFILGKRSYCNHLCTIAPIMNLGMKLRKLAGGKYKSVVCEGGCIDCKKCDNSCSVGLDVSGYAKKGEVTHPDCVSCLACVDSCPKKVLEYKRITVNACE